MRLRRLETELAGRVRVEWLSFLLRPHPDRGRPLERFRAYTQSWLRPAAEPDAGTFRPWTTDAGPPSHFVPPHVLAKAAAALGDAAFQRVHERLLHAYFAENRDITALPTLSAVWREAGLPDDAVTRLEDPALARAVLAEHEAAVGAGITGVPAVRVQGTDVFVTGALPLETYRRWVLRLLADPGLLA